MGKDTRPGTTEEIFASPVPNAPLLRAAVTRSLASSSLNPVAFGNQAILAKKKRAILYKNGYTLPGKATALLAAEAASGIKHSQKLGRNLRNANPSSVSAFASIPLVAPDATMCKPTPGSNILTRISPSDSDPIEAAMNHSIALPAMRPTVRASVMYPMPTTSVENTNGAITIFISRRKIVLPIEI